MNKQVHIIAFDVPFPPDYGGVIDIYYKLKALYEEGIKISLHCFEYGRGQKKELEKYCEKVFYYRRKSNKHLLFNSLPYIAASRSSEELMNNLLKDDAPILLEGLHCCFHLKDERIKSRKKIVRMHNIEHTYYANLALVEKNYFRRKYFEKEAKKLEKFEAVLKYADAIGAISPSDTKELSLRYKNVSNVMAFHPHEIIEIKDGKGDFALYHGSLAIGENNKAALYLVNEIFNDMGVPLIIAGNGASSALKEAVKKNVTIQLREGISTDEIYSLVQNAQINILPTFQATGIKLKLLSALYSGRHCIVNSAMVAHTGLEPLCHIADSSSEMKKEILRLMNTSFNGEEKQKRAKILEENFSNKKNVKQLMELIMGTSKN
ncbi:MAG: glycosyltransferase [Bacteroidota bacterium]